MFKKSIVKITLILPVFLLLVTMSGCVSKAKVSYLLGADDYADSKLLPTTYEIRIQPDDQLAVTVSSSEKELLEPFTNKVAIGTGGAAVGGGGTQGRASGGAWFTVDKEGYIEFPVFGLMKVVGYTRTELARMIEQKLKSGGYTQDPVVTVELMSFKVVVLSNDQSSIVRCGSERFTILEAIAQSGGVSMTNERQNVLVLREQDGKVQSYRVDLSDARATLSSPVYFLKQNDVIYIEPNGAARVDASPFYKYMSSFTSIAGLISTVVGVALIWKSFK